jgi:hypothetical protein
VVGRTVDVIACNPSGLRLFAGLADWPASRRNMVRHVFLHPRARTLFSDWEEQARACVGRLRALAGIEPDAPDLAVLVDELHSRSPEFTDLGERYDVIRHTHGSATFHHPEAGDITPGHQSTQIEGTPGRRFTAYFAEPGSDDHDRLVLLDMAVARTSPTAP